MALSNIGNEPRREITESVLGIIVFAALVGGIIWVDRFFAQWLMGPLNAVDNSERFACYVIGFLIIMVGMLVSVGVLFLTHSLGEGICEFLAARGLELRPKQRYNK